jgi:hypothetical protein
MNLKANQPLLHPRPCPPTFITTFHFLTILTILTILLTTHLSSPLTPHLTPLQVPVKTKGDDLLGGSSLVLGAGGNANGKGGALCALSGARSESGDASVMTSESGADGKMVVGSGDASARSGNMVIPNILMNGTASPALILCSVLFCPTTPTVYATVISIHFCALNSAVCSARRQYGGIMTMLVMMVIALPGTDSDVRNKEQNTCR